jgi:hypothetical protein
LGLAFGLVDLALSTLFFWLHWANGKVEKKTNQNNKILRIKEENLIHSVF